MEQMGAEKMPNTNTLRKKMKELQMKKKRKKRSKSGEKVGEKGDIKEKRKNRGW